MSGQIDIHHGGAIAVDPEALRGVGARIAAVAVEFGRAEHSVGRALGVILDAPWLSGAVDTSSLERCRRAIGALRAHCDEAARSTLLMADVYELVELHVQAELLAATDGAASDALMRRIERLEASDERLAPMAQSLIADWRDGRYAGLDGQHDFGGLLAPFLMAAPFIGSWAGRGIVPEGATLAGRADAVRVTQVRASSPVTTPGSLADALRRMPRADGAQVAVEKLVMPGGAVHYVAYVKGTQAPTQGGSEPWDMKSNAELYTGHASASFQATVDALRAAGAEAGDRVDVVAHSQAGMIGAYLESESGFEVGTQITAGSPVSPIVDENHLLVQLGYTDDIVRSLAGGGSPGGSGSPDSFTATADHEEGLFDVNLPWNPHLLETYIEMAEQIDDSGDPRAVALDEYWRELNQAETIERTEYHAVRTETVPSGDPHQYIDHLAR